MVIIAKGKHQGNLHFVVFCICTFRCGSADLTHFTAKVAFVELAVACREFFSCSFIKFRRLECCKSHEHQTIIENCFVVLLYDIICSTW